MFSPRFKSTLSLLMLLGAPMLSVAQSLADDIPDCALSCTQTAATNVGCATNLSDRACLCSHIVGFSASAFLCASSSNTCTRGDLGSLNGALSSVCSSAGNSPPPSSNPSNPSGSITVPVTTPASPASSPSPSSPSLPSGASNTSALPTPENTTAPRLTTTTGTITPATTPPGTTLSPPTAPAPPATQLGGPLGGPPLVAGSPSPSSTVLVVETVVLPQATSGASAVRRGGEVLGLWGAVGAVLLGAVIV